ncbi:MAG: ClpP-like prohead protease/major capsid protein fusion protein [Pseudomonadota bacterium]
MPDQELLLYGTVGQDFWGEDCFTARSVADALAEMTGPVTVRINSGGGIADDGMAIYNQLRDYAATKGEVEVVVDACAASAASLIAMAGDRIVMKPGAHIMIHDPASPFTAGRGTEDDHRQAADALSIAARGYARVYAARAGIGVDAAREIMRAETWLLGDDAVAQGFADLAEQDLAEESAEPVAATFDYGIYRHAPQALRGIGTALQQQDRRMAIVAVIAGLPARNMKEGLNMAKDDDEMNDDTVVTAEAGDEPNDDAVATEGDDTVMAGDDTVMAEDDEDETPMAAQILDVALALGRPVAEARELIASGVGLHQATMTMNQNIQKEGKMTQTQARPAQARRSMVDARDKFVEGATRALIMKAGAATEEAPGERNEFSSMSLGEIARHAIGMSDASRRFDSRQAMIGHAFTMEGGAHSTSDFAQILSNVQSKAVLLGWDEAEETFQLWTQRGTLVDYKPAKRVGLGLIEALPEVIEGANYTYATVGDRGEDIVLADYGKILRITRQAIINDDLSLLGTVPRRMGRAAKRTIGNLAYGVLINNPTMSDGIALFHADHGNLAATGGLPAVPTLDAARTAMRLQKDAGHALNIKPHNFLVPAKYELDADVLINSTVDPRDQKGHARNPVAGMAAVIADARLDAAADGTALNAWYMTGNPAMHDTVEVAYLDGNDAPYLEEQNGWTSDGVEMKVRITAGVSPTDYRAMYKNPGPS